MPAITESLLQFRYMESLIHAILAQPLYKSVSYSNGLLQVHIDGLVAIYSKTLGLLLHSQAAKLKQTLCGRKVYLKRDDLLGGFIPNGTKVRKYASLLPHLIHTNHPSIPIGIIGGLNSNNVLSLSAFLRQHGLPSHLFLCQTPGIERQDVRAGENAWLLRLLLATRAWESITWIPRESWASADRMALEYFAANYAKEPEVTFNIIQEGAANRESLPGLLTLPLDILQNEQALKIQFTDIFIEAGSGSTAATLIAAFEWLKIERTLIHVLLVAGERDGKDFEEKVLPKMRRDLGELVGQQVQENHPAKKIYRLRTPKNAKSFGATNAKVFQTISNFARTEGILLEPIYSAKLIYHLFHETLEKDLSPNSTILICHQGGLNTLQGYSKNFVGPN